MAIANASRGHTLFLDAITHRFGAVTAVREVTLEVAAGEMVALLGPSGCGKSTLLRIIAGFTRQTVGRVLIDGESIDHLAPSRRRVGIVFQNYALFPHMSVAENIAYGLDARGVKAKTAQSQVEAMLRLVQMAGFAERLPRELSGGQQQRVALARALAVEPRILLLDEPFGALDKSLRLDMQIEIKRLQREYGITTIIVTHDQEEALSMADRIAVLNHGAVEQFDSPMSIYDRPASVFVSAFVGTTNLLPGEVVGPIGDGITVRLDCGATVIGAAASRFAVGARVLLAVRPERLRVESEPAPDRIAGMIKAALPLGAATIYEVETGDRRVFKLATTRDGESERGALRFGDRVHLALVSAGSCIVFAAGDAGR